jgi:hypothetical protein
LWLVAVSVIDFGVSLLTEMVWLFATGLPIDPNCDLGTQLIVAIHITVPVLTFRANCLTGTDGFDTNS